MHRDRLTRGTALDVAAGTGDNAALLALAGWCVTACDLSDEAMLLARRRAAELKAPVRLVQAEGARLPFRPGSFDAVVCTYFHDPDVARRLPGLLKPGGTLFYKGFTTRHLGHAPTFRPEFCIPLGGIRSFFPGLTEVLTVEEDARGEAWALFIGRK